MMNDKRDLSILKKDLSISKKDSSVLKKNLKKDFPILKGDISYLDNAATTQKPKVVIESLKGYYENSNANAHRGVYALSEKATVKQDTIRKTID